MAKSIRITILGKSKGQRSIAGLNEPLFAFKLLHVLLLVNTTPEYYRDSACYN